MRSKLFAMMLGGAATVATAPVSNAYPIDCAILLCLAGGFPASAECSAAKAEFIRRITPWPIEPPLQLWNCPMRSSGGVPVPGVGADGLTDDVRRYRDDIEIYHVRSYQRQRHKDSEDTFTDITSVGAYASGPFATSEQFQWMPSSYRNGPAWLAEAAGGTTSVVTTGGCSDVGHWPGLECPPVVTDSTNDYLGRLRGVFIRFKDYSGTYHVHGIHY